MRRVRRALAAVAGAAVVAWSLVLPASAGSGGTGETCMATYYDQGTTTASGEPFDPEALTAAHRTLPFGTMVEVTDTDNGNSVVVRINDRGPFAPDRCIDLSRAAFARLAPLSRGVIPVTLGLPATAPSARDLATRILADQRITLATSHLDPRGDDPPDGASAHDNIADTSRGIPARRSSYANAQGGTVALSPAMLQGLLDLASRFAFDVAEIAGGSHPSKSRRAAAAGASFDVDVIDGRQVLGLGGEEEQRFMDGCRAGGASDVRVEGLHIHCGWR